MNRYVDWQNTLLSPVAMRAGRFVEIPSLHQAGLFRRSAVIAATEGTLQFRDDPQWAVDMHFWLMWFHCGKVCGKIPEKTFFWRQHPKQQTRVHGRLSIENLRKCKADFICRPGGPLCRAAAGEAVSAVQVWSIGSTLEGWVHDLLADGNPPGQVVPVEWKPGTPLPSVPTPPHRPVRLFAYGSEKVRNIVRQAMQDGWDDELDLFVG
jgi:hypothetical protein